MIKSVTIVNSLGEILQMDLTQPERSGLIIESIDGLGPGSANVNFTNLVGDGGVFNSSRLDPRSITFNFIFEGNDIELIRHKTYRFFSLKSTVTLMVKTDYRELMIEGRVSSNDPGIFQEREGTTISIECGFPYFYKIGDGAEINTPFSGATPLFEFPFENLIETREIEFGEINNLIQNTITYEGDVDIGMIITMHLSNDVGDITIHKLNTREHLTLENDRIIEAFGFSYQAGDDIIINTNRGVKTIFLRRDGQYYNLLPAKTVDSTWLTLSRGDNDIAIVTSHDPQNLVVDIQNRILYEGI